MNLGIACQFTLVTSNGVYFLISLMRTIDCFPRRTTSFVSITVNLFVRSKNRATSILYTCGCTLTFLLSDKIETKANQSKKVLFQTVENSNLPFFYLYFKFAIWSDALSTLLNKEVGDKTKLAFSVVQPCVQMSSSCNKMFSRNEFAFCGPEFNSTSLCSFVSRCLRRSRGKSLKRY